MDDQAQSGQPLFQNTDAQEQAYAPQQLPRANDATIADAVTGDVTAAPLSQAVPPAAPTSTTAPELTLTAPVDLAARSIADNERNRDEAER
jgi:hypothetical protein